ncbi:MAG: hypothetical protein EBZ59_04860 [Planctomycetia bacterium]|nr:hypothetical protein [Planctomycetia bacterium]
MRVALSAATALYSLVLVVTTHYPHPEEILDALLAGRQHPSDKSMHLIAYCVLGLLAAVTVLAHGRLTPQNAARLAAWLAAAAVLDELTQPLFNRHTDPVDWVCDCVGILVGIVVVASVADAATRWQAHDADRKTVA